MSNGPLHILMNPIAHKLSPDVLLLAVMGDLALMRDEFYSSICSADGYTVAPMLSSILSEYQARNTTVEVPALTLIDFFTATATFDLSDNTMSHEAFTRTMYGVAFASLPQIAAPTERVAQ